MAQNQMTAANESDVTPAGEETLDFDDDTLRGEEKSFTFFSHKTSIYEANTIHILP